MTLLGANRRLYPSLMLAPCLALSSVLWSDNALSRDLPVAVNGSVTVSGDAEVYDTVTIAGTLNVAKFAGDAQTGWVHLRAHEITIEATGVIDASAAGYRGSSDQNPMLEQGSGAGATPAEIFTMMTPAPGGGGSHSGAGGLGISPTGSCTEYIGAGRGLTYNTDINNPPAAALAMGSAGGASRSTSNPTYVGRGGDGGGGVILEAAKITIDGEINVNGEEGRDTLGAGPGGGAAGAIVILSNDLTIGSTANFTANGGNAGLAMQLFGGAGGGGMVVFAAPAMPSLGTVISTQVTVTGGDGALTCPTSYGSDGLAAHIAEPGCIDADSDGFPNVLCGGDDCNDGNADVNVDIDEFCNGIDDNCDGDIDEEAPSLCQAGFECVNAECVQTMSGSGSSGATTPGAPQVHYAGGLCSTTSGSTTLGSTASGSSWSSAASRLAPYALLLGLVGLVARRRRNRRRGRQ